MVRRLLTICILSTLATMVARADCLKGDVDGDGRITLSDITALADILTGKVDPYGGHSFVDLRLPNGTLWATTNIGAATPEQAGYYFAWGETIWGKDAYDWMTYDHCLGTENTFVRYCTSSKYGTKDGQRTLLPAHDAARQLWGRFWRMPTLDEALALVGVNMNTQWRKQNGVQGLWVQGQNFQSVFLPAAGYHHNEGFYEKGEVCSYWLNELSRGGDDTMAFCLTADADFRSWTIRKRSSGRTIRPVAIPLTEVCDLNEDGKVTVADLAELIRKTLPPPSL